MPGKAEEIQPTVDHRRNMPKVEILLGGKMSLNCLFSKNWDMIVFKKGLERKVVQIMMFRDIHTIP